VHVPRLARRCELSLILLPLTLRLFSRFPFSTLPGLLFSTASLGFLLPPAFFIASPVFFFRSPTFGLLTSSFRFRSSSLAFGFLPLLFFGLYELFPPTT